MDCIAPKTLVSSIVSHLHFFSSSSRLFKAVIPSSPIISWTVVTFCGNLWKYHLISKVMHRRGFSARTGARRFPGGMGIADTRMSWISLHRLWKEVLSVGFSLFTAIMWLRKSHWSPVSEPIYGSLHPRVASSTRFLGLSSNLSEIILFRWWRAPTHIMPVAYRPGGV